MQVVEESDNEQHKSQNEEEYNSKLLLLYASLCLQ